jgi:hypothetical protein
MARKKYAVAGGSGPKGLSYHTTKKEAQEVAKKRGNKLRRWSEGKGRYVTAKGR